MQLRAPSLRVDDSARSGNLNGICFSGKDGVEALHHRFMSFVCARL